MTKKMKVFLTVITVSLVTLLTGCNSEGAFSSDGITISPSPVLLAHRNSQQLTAIWKHDDGIEEDISNSAKWEIVGDPTIITLSSTGLVTAGTTLGEVKVVASKDGIFSEEVTVTVSNLAGPVIDIFDTGSGKLFTNTPSKAYYDRIDVNASNNHLVYTAPSDIYGPPGDFYLFYGILGLALCETYNAKSIGGRTNWRIAEKRELEEELVGKFGDMYTARGWPTFKFYHGVDNKGIANIDLSGNRLSDIPSISGNNGYLSCVSNPVP